MTGSEYTRLHEALEVVAKKVGVSPFDCRVILALDERGGQATTLDLHHDLRSGDSGSAVRRAVTHLYANLLANGNGVDGGRRRQGIRTCVTLTPKGERAAAIIRELAAA